MNSQKTHALAPLVLTFCVIAGVAHAAPVPIETSTLDAKPKSDHTFGIGFTSSVAQRPFTGVDDQKASLPYVSYRYKQFYIEGLNIGFNLLSTNDYKFDLLATPRFYEIDAESASNGELAGIDKTKPTYFVGVATRFRNDIALLTVQLLTDIKESDGSELVISVSKAFTPTTDLTLSPSLGLTAQDAKLVDHFYGVQANEVRAGRPAYRGQSSLNYHAAVTAAWKVTQHIQLLGQFKYEKLGDGITDSPIVANDSVRTLAIGAVYHF